MNHWHAALPNGEPHPDMDVIFADRHDVRLAGGVPRNCSAPRPSGSTRCTARASSSPANASSSRAAEDETIEAIAIADAPGFALGVQWHAEHDANRNPINRTLFEAFGKALVKYLRAR